MASVKRPYFEFGFWWWWNPTRGDWFVGPSPQLSAPPSWAEES